MADLVLHLTGEDAQNLRVLMKELNFLRTIVTEKFAESDLHVKPEDAADVLRWARNPEAVRQLLKLHPWEIGPHHDFENDSPSCAGCNVPSWEPHHSPTCRVFAAWAALDDPRAAEAIGAAFDRARRRVDREAMVEEFSRMQFHEVGGDFVARSHCAMRERNPFRAAAQSEREYAIGAAVATRQHSDARGMEAVEDEAWDLNGVPEAEPALAP